MKQLYFLLAIFAPFVVIAQKNYEPEKIIWEGNTYPYRYHHMEQYFNYYPDKRPVPNKDTTIINRNYVAIFEMKERKFYLNDILIKGRNSAEKKLSVYKELSRKGDPMFLTWITGLFDIGIGKENFTKTDSITPIYEQYIVFEIKKGTLGRTEHFTYNQLKLFKDYQYKRFKETLDYQRLYRRLRYNGMSESEVSSHVYEFILFYSKSNFLKKN